MSALLVTLSALTTMTMAQQQSSVLSLPFYGYDAQPIVASVVSANPTATTLSLACRAGTDASDCGLFPVQLLTVGPSTYHMSMGAGDSFTGTQDCSTMGTTAAVCSESAGGEGANFPGASVTSYEGTEVGVLGVTVTAGVDRLGASASSSGPASASATATSSGEVTVLTGTATGTTSSGSMSESSSQTGSATGSAAAETSSSAAIANISGRSSSLFVAAMSMLGFWFY